ncbi:MAG: hypothetical protein IPK03_09105 [Bacteroidetes bacterium]|nr:hypothetical protein [Bacteroidota bacterium]
MQKFFLQTTLLFISLFGASTVFSQCYSGGPSYCTNITASNVASYGMGMQNVTLNTTAIPSQINNNTAAGSGSPIYFDYTSQVLNAPSGGTVNYSVRGPSGNASNIRMFIDYNNDGTFNTSGSELVLNLLNVPTSGIGNIVSGTFVLPTLSAGVYRIRFASDFQGVAVPAPCGPLTYSAEVEDYTLIVPSGTMDVSVAGIPNPGFFLTGNNTVAVRFLNLSNTTITTADIGYQLGANAPVSESLTGLSIASGQTYIATFTTPLNIASTGSFSMKAWANNANGSGSVTPANDTACRSFTVYCSGPLSGNYTIDPAGSGPTNFINFNIADSNLITCGVSGPVTFTVAAGTYTGVIDLPAIPGASATNTITLNGVNSATRILTNLTTAVNPAVLRLNACSYVTFKNFTIRTTGTSDGWAVHLYNGLNNKINKCILDIAGAGATSSSANLAGVVINGSYASITGANSSGNGHIVDSSTFNAGYYNIYTIAGSAVTYSFLYNVLNNSYQYAGYFNNSHTIKFNNNVINLRASNATNIGLQYFNCNASGTHEIRNNIFNNIGQYGIVFFTASGGSGSGQIYNNFFAGFKKSNGSAAIYNQGSSSWKIWHNTINIDFNATSGNTDCIYLNGGSGFDIRNNHLTISAISCVNANPMRFTSTSCASAVDYNNYFNASNTTLAAIPTALTAGTYLAAYPTGVGANSMNTNPGYINNNTNLHVTNPCLNGTNLGLTTDIDSQARTSTPDIGADEIPSFASDAMVMAIRSPATAVVTPGSLYTITITVRNAGTSTITDLDANYSVNGVVTSETFTGLNILPCDTLQLNFTSTYTFTGGNNIFRAFTGNVNTGADLNNSNDTMTTNFCTPFSGTFTINKTLPQSQTNFTSVQSAINAVYGCGINGPVTLRIASGTGPCNEQVLFNGIVPGSNFINTVRLSGNTTREAITFLPTNSSAQHVIRLQATKCIILDSLTINNTGTSFGTGVHITSLSDSNFVQNSIINISLASTSFSNSAGIAISTIAANATGAGNNGNTNTINNNAINGGYFGITAIGTNSTTFCLRNIITNNILNGQAYYGIYHFYQNNTKVNGNAVDNMLSTNTNGYAMQFQNIDNFEINKNKINRFGQMGMYFNGTNHQGGSGTNRSQINNNMIGGIAYNANPYGMYFQIGSAPSTYRYVDFWHNTIHIDNMSSSGYAHYFSNTTANSIFGLDYRNNTFTVKGNTSTFFYSRNTSGPTFINFLNNNIYSISNPAGSSVYMTTSSTSGNAWISASFGGVNTSSCRGVDPLFINASTNLHTISTPLSNVGINTSITSDIDGDVRPLAPSGTVDIGADEFNIPAENIGAFAVISPALPLTPGLQNVVVQIRNYGSATITAANVRYKVGVNGTIKTFPWTGTLTTGSNTNITFTGANQHNFAGTIDTIFTWTDAPNGLPDGYTANDSLLAVICGPLSGNYTIDSAMATDGSNFRSFNDAIASLNSCGITGPVRFTIAARTYNGALSIGSVFGASAVNTVIFDGVNSANVIITAPTSAAAPAVLRFNACSFVTFRNVTIRSTDVSNGWAAHFFNGTSNRVSNSILDIGGAGATSGNSNLAPVVINGSLTSMSTNSTFANNHRVDSSILNAGYYGIYTNVSTNTNTFYYLNNTINSAYYYGAFFSNAHVVKFNNNVVNLRGINTATAGLYMQSVNPSGVLFSEINNNKFTNIGQYGIYMSSCSGSGSVQGQLYNNMISGFVYTSGNVGMYVNSTNRWNIWHNSVNLDFASLGGQNNCIFVQNGSSNDVRNNILSITSPTIVAAVPFYVTPNSAVSALNNNIYFNASSSNLITGSINSNSTNYNLNFPLGGGSGSMNVNPRFVNNSTDLHTLNGCNTGTNLGLTADFDNQSRGTIPDIGADETSPSLNNDMGVLKLNTPSFPLLAGSTNINVTLKNYGLNTINSVTVSYMVNGGSLTTQTLTGLSLAACDTMNFTFTTPYTVTGPSNFSVFTSNPNGTGDSYLLNDTINRSLCVAMNGAYSINGGGGGDFISFSAAIAQLNCGGVSGPVTFNVASGTYTEQITIGEVPGASAINTITFNGGTGNASSRILTFAGTFANPHTFRLNASNYINIRNLTIRSTDGTNGWPLNIINCQNIIVANCNIEVAGAGATATGSNLAAVVLNGSTTSMSTASSNNSNIIIDSNNIKGGYYGISTRMPSSPLYTNVLYTRYNNIDSSYFYGIFNDYHTQKCLYNVINNRVNGPSSSSGIYVQTLYFNTPDFGDFSYNKIFNCRQYGMYFGTFYTNNGSFPNQVNNNVIGRFLGTGVASRGIYVGFCTNSVYQHNTINVDNPSTSGNRAFYIQANGSILVRNNIFAIGNASATNAIPVQFASVSATCSNNAYYNAVGANLIQTTSGTFTAAAGTFPTAGGGTGSISANPQFPSAYNLKLGAAVAATTFNSTLSIATLPYDMDYIPRVPILGTTTPDMGAYEKTTTNVGVSAIVWPITVTAGSTDSIRIRIRNYGSDAVSNFPVKYRLNGTMVTETYVPSLAANDSVIYTFATTATFAGCNALMAQTALVGDTYGLNDSTKVNIGGSIIGTYTVKPGGGGNFTTLTAAVASLNCGVVTGPVIFLVDPSTYNEQITIPSTIVGVSATNTITFDGGNGNASSVILSFATGLTSSGLSHVLRFNNCNFITFRNMTIRSSGASNAWTVHFMNGTNNRLNNCIVDMSGTGTTSTSSGFNAIVMNGSTTSISTVSTIANNHRIDSCSINFGYYGLYCYLNNGNLVNYFTNNTWNNAYQYGVIFQNAQTIKFNNNTINTRASMTTAYGIYLSSVNPLGTNFNEVNGNRILRTGQYGIYFVSTQGGPINQGQCYNNLLNGMTYNFSTVGIFLNSASNWNLYHNTINHDILSAGGPNYGMQIQNGSNNDVRNNMLSTTIPGTSNWTPLWISPSSAVVGVNNNNYWNPSSANLVHINGVNYTAANYKANYPLGGGLNSLNNNPSYVSAFDIHVTNPCNNGANLAVTVDVDGNTRVTSPDIGADEMNTVPNNDLGVFIINSPAFPLATGSQSINVTLKNYGGNTITAADINYTVNGGSLTTQAWTGSLAPCDTISLTLTTPYNFTAGSSNLKVFTTNPNGVSDITPSNDTAQWTLCPAMAGTYTIGGGGNYATFNAAISDLYCAGVSGHVTFVVANGTYAEQVSIAPINGASSTKRIRFTSASGNPSLTTLTFTPVSSGSYTLQFNGADYITFDRMTIANGYTASTVYTTWITNGADFDSISNCVIQNPINTNAYGVYQSNSTDRSFTMFNDSIKNGGYGLMMQSNTTVPSTNHAYVNNVLFNQTNSYAIYSYFQDSVLISGNTITTNAPASTFYGIYTQSNTKFPRITKNKIVGINAITTCYGIMLNSYGANGFSFGRGLISNNFIQLGGAASTNFGVYFSSGSNYTDFMHNSINMTSTLLSTNVACFYYTTSLTGNTVQNNIFQASGNGTTSCAVANIGTSGTSGCVFNNNNFFSRNATTFGYCGTSNGTSQTSYNNFKTGGSAIASFESVGLNREVSFVSTTDLHTTTPCIANAGANVLSIVPDDIDNVARTSTPDIGADEFTTNAYDASVIYVRSPANSVVTPGSPYTIVITVRNNGSAAITTLDANYAVNGGTATSQTFAVGSGLPVGGIQACDTLQLTFTVLFTFGAGGNNVFRAFTGNVNSNADLVNSNDTFTTNFCTPFSGVFTINKNLPQTQTNFTSVQSAVNAVYSCGVIGPVTLRIDAGSGPYNEQVLFSGIVPGSSATNYVRLTGNTTKETITWLPIAFNQQHTIRLQSAKHILLDSLTINNTGTSYGIGVHMTATSDSNFVQNSNVNISLASTSFSNSAGIAISSNAASATGTGNNGNKNTISNNSITGGYYGITSFGTNTTTFCQNNQFVNNTFNGQAYYGMYLAYQSLTSINGNNIDNFLSTNLSSMGMRFEYVERFEIKRIKSIERVLTECISILQTIN